MPIIAFEGLDGVGKTSLANAYAKASGGISIATAYFMRDQWKERRRAVNRGNDVEARFRFFLDFNRDQFEVAQMLSEMGDTVTLDSSVYRTVATHRLLGSAAALAYEIPDDLRPDHTFLLTVPESERLRRFCERGDSPGGSSVWDEQLLEHQVELRGMFATFGMVKLDGRQTVPQLIGDVNGALRV